MHVIRKSIISDEAQHPIAVQIDYADWLEIERSLFNYGLPDISSLGVRSTTDQKRLLWMIESTIANFEPRIQGPRVTMEPVEGSARILRFQIQGLLRIDPAPERVTFDTVLELTSGEYQVKGG